MSDGKNALKLPGDHIDFNSNLKINLSLLFDAQKSIYTKEIRTWNFWALVSFIPSDTKYSGTREKKLWGKSFIFQFTNLLKEK